MAIEISYGRIYWKKNMPVFHMVSPAGYDFEIYPEPLIAMHDRQKKPVHVKWRTLSEKKSKGLYPGDIYGMMMTVSVLKNKKPEPKYICIILYFGEAGRDMIVYDDDRVPEHCIDTQQYYFVVDEFDHYLESMRSMSLQQDSFMKYKMNANIKRMY